MKRTNQSYKSPVFPVRLSRGEREKLAALAEETQLSRGGVLRRLLVTATAEHVAQTKYEGGPKVSDATGTTL